MLNFSFTSSNTLSQVFKCYIKEKEHRHSKLKPVRDKSPLCFGSSQVLSRRLCKRIIGEMQKQYLNRSLLCVTRQQTNGKPCATSRGFYLLVFYILIASFKASDVGLWGGGGEVEEDSDGGFWRCWGKRLPSELFFESEREDGEMGRVFPVY